MSSTTTPLHEYRVYLARHPDIEPHEYAVILHRTDSQQCSIFTTVQRAADESGDQFTFELWAETYERPSQEHTRSLCRVLQRRAIGYVKHEHLPMVHGTFLECAEPPRASRVMVFRWLGMLVDLGLLDAEAVRRVQPDPGENADSVQSIWRVLRDWTV